LAQNEIYKMDTNGSKLFSLIFVEKWRFSWKPMIRSIFSPHYLALF
jgi:hypothetical protein